MRQERTLAHGGRVLGSVCLTVLALVSLGWIIRDFAEAHEITDVWWMWAGLTARAEGGLWVSSALDPLLLIVYAVAAALVLRSSSAAGLLAATGALTVLLRVPGLWSLTAGWRQGIDEDLKNQALLTVAGAVVLGLVLLVTAAAGRRPVDPGDPAYGPAFDPAERPPARPTGGSAVVSLLLLGASAVALAAWEIYWWVQSAAVYGTRITGERALISLLSTPGGWTAWALAVLALTAAVAAVARAAFARPLGLVTAWMLLGGAVFALSSAVKHDVFAHFEELGSRLQLHVATDVGLVLVGLAVLLTLPRGEEPLLEDDRGWPPPGGPSAGSFGAPPHGGAPPGPPGSPAPPYGPPSAGPGPYGGPGAPRPPEPPPGW